MNVEILEREESWVQMVFRDLRVFLVHLVQMGPRYCTDESLLTLLSALDTGAYWALFFLNRAVLVHLVQLVMLVLQVFRECQERGAYLALQVPKVKGYVYNFICFKYIICCVSCGKHCCPMKWNKIFLPFVKLL